MDDGETIMKAFEEWSDKILSQFYVEVGSDEKEYYIDITLGDEEKDSPDVDVSFELARFKKKEEAIRYAKEFVDFLNGV